MRGPIRVLWDTRLISGYLRIILALVLGGLLAVWTAAVAINLGGVAGVVALLLAGMLGLVVLYVVFIFSRA